MTKVKELFNKYSSLIRYGFFGVITVIINLVLYKLFLVININYIIASVISYFIASLVSYYFNLFFVFNQRINGFFDECIRIAKYFGVRIGSVVADTLLLYLAVDKFKFDKFYSKLFISFFIILITYFFNKKILRKGDA